MYTYIFIYGTVRVIYTVSMELHSDLHLVTTVRQT